MIYHNTVLLKYLEAQQKIKYKLFTLKLLTNKHRNWLRYDTIR